jgi:hypothetical protein
VTTSTQRDVTDRGAAAGGPPVAIATKEHQSPKDELRIGPLPEPTLLERLRSSWSLEALIPSFEPDPSMPPRKGFRIAGALALAVHAVILTGIVIIGRYAIFTFIDDPSKPKVVMLGPDEYRPVTDAPGRETNPADGGGPNGGAPADGGGSNTDTKPATAGVLPKTSPVPSPVPLNLPPPPTPVSLPMDPTIQGPDLPVPAPTGQIGLPGAPDAPGDFSAGANGGGGVGNGSGDGAGNGRDGAGGPSGPGSRPGPGGSGGGDRPGGTNTPGPGGAGGGVLDRNVRLIAKAKPVIPKKMIETQTFGTVSLSVTIGPDGSVLRVVPVNTLQGGGTQAAIDAVYRCQFGAAIRNGVAVTETTLVTFAFRPN